jgi:flagellum-specific peptidoglycan hydrolase FlgJ
MKYAITFFLVVVLAIIPQSVTTATRATRYKPANVPKTHDVPKVGTKVAFSDKVALQALIAIQNAKEKGLRTPLPSLLTAQVIHESGGGNSYLVKAANNYNGIRAKAGEPFVWAKDDGKMRKFKKYSSLSASMADAIRVMNNSRYKGMFNEQSTYGQALALQNGFYASDRKYAKKLSSIATQHNLKRYDK